MPTPSQKVDLGPPPHRVTEGVRACVTVDYMVACLARHARGDWGICDAYDRGVNDTMSRLVAGRVLSAYPIDPDKPSLGYGSNTLWIITEWSGDDRRTTLLLPDEY